MTGRKWLVAGTWQKRGKLAKIAKIISNHKTLVHLCICYLFDLSIKIIKERLSSVPSNQCKLYSVWKSWVFKLKQQLPILLSWFFKTWKIFKKLNVQRGKGKDGTFPTIFFFNVAKCIRQSAYIKYFIQFPIVSLGFLWNRKIVCDGSYLFSNNSLLIYKTFSLMQQLTIMISYLRINPLAHKKWFFDI